MNDDEFLKELEEVTKDLEKEYSKNQIIVKNEPTNNINTTTTTTNNTSKTNNTNQTNQIPTNSNMDPTNFGNLFQNFDFGNDSDNINLLKKLTSEFNDKDPESMEMMKKISKLFIFILLVVEYKKWRR
jgi:hypothetical protein